MKKGENGGVVHVESSVEVYRRSERMTVRIVSSHVPVEDLASLLAKVVAIKVVK